MENIFVYRAQILFTISIMLPIMNAWALALIMPVVAADAGDDFSNNLFTDLGPYDPRFYL